jgi:hypothetical protein
VRGFALTEDPIDAVDGDDDVDREAVERERAEPREFIKGLGGSRLDSEDQIQYSLAVDKI